MVIKLIHLFTLATVVLLSSCTKQSPTNVEESFAETIEKDRLDACTRMNLFTNLYEHSNLVAAFDCTKWSKQFPLMRQKLGSFKTGYWNGLFLPLSTYAFNDRKVLKQFIAATQKLDDENGLEDLGAVIGALTDTNFYDGMNELFKCASKEECRRSHTVDKKDITNLFSMSNILGEKRENIHQMFTHMVTSLDVLSNDFSQTFSSLLNSGKFKAKRTDLLNLLVKLISRDRSKFDRSLFPKIFKVDANDMGNSLFGWLNSDQFSSSFIQEVMSFTKRHPLAVKDLRSIGQIRKLGLKCENESSSTFFVNIDAHLLVLLKKISTLEIKELEAYLENDLALHQVASQACPEFKSIKVRLDEEEHELSVVRMKQSMLEFLHVPGVLSIAKIMSKKIVDSTEGDEKVLGDFLSKYSKDDYLGGMIDFLEIIEEQTPSLIDQYVRLVKSLPKQFHENTSSLLTYFVDSKQDEIWPSLEKTWFFFTASEKDFLFNYIDKHFTNKNNYKLLFAYYLDVFTILKPALPSIVAIYSSPANSDQNYNALKDFSNSFHGEEVLKEFSRFFSRSHILKVIELFINGERLTAWANEIRSLLPTSIPNRLTFKFDGGFSTDGAACLGALAVNDLDLLIKNFPTNCQHFESASLLQKISLLSELNALYKSEFNIDLFSPKGLLSPAFMQSIIILAKKLYVSLGSVENLESLLEWQQQTFQGESLKSLAKNINLFINDIPEVERKQFQENLLLVASNSLSDDALMGSFKRVAENIAAWRKGGSWREIVSRKYPEQLAELTCAEDLNQSIGGNVCPTKKNILSFSENFTKYLTRHNGDDSPIAVRQFLVALDPSAGLSIPLRSSESHKKNISIKESLRMFYDLSDKSRDYNKKILHYRRSSGATDEVVTTMERIEIVIREVNFDENYLGAHYKNAVSKAQDYQKTVSAKAKLFGICVKAGFCGKFMSRKEKRMAKNAIAAFPSLLDVNRNGLHYDDYMKALLGVAVSSSSRVSQISTLVSFREGESSFNIPWIQTKRQLRKHNGKILCELADISAFSNMARWTRDRFARNEASFKEFINSKELNLINENLFKNFAASVNDEALIKFFTQLGRNENLVVDDIVDFINDLSYSELRRLEDTIGDVLVIASSIIKSDDTRNWNQIMELGSWLVKSYPTLKLAWGDLSLKPLIFNFQPLIEHVAQSILSEDDDYTVVVSKFYEKFEELVLANKERPVLLSILQDHFDSAQAKAITQVVKDISAIWSDHMAEDDARMALIYSASAQALDIKTLEGISEYLKFSANKRACVYEGELVVCQKNIHYLELWRGLELLTTSEENWNKFVPGFIDSPAALSRWMADSLDLIRLQN